MAYPASSDSDGALSATSLNIWYTVPCCALTSGASSVSRSLPTVTRSRCPWSMRVNLATLVLSQSCSWLVGRAAQVVDHRVDVVFELRDLAARFNLDRSRQVAFGDRGRNLRDRAHLVGQIGRQQVDVAGEILPRAGRAGYVRLTAKTPFDAHFASDVGHLFGERRQRVGHVVDRLGERGDFSLCLDGQFLSQVSVRDRGDDLDDA